MSVNDAPWKVRWLVRAKAVGPIMSTVDAVPS